MDFVVETTKGKKSHWKRTLRRIQHHPNEERPHRMRKMSPKWKYELVKERSKTKLEIRTVSFRKCNDYPWPHEPSRNESEVRRLLAVENKEPKEAGTKQNWNRSGAQQRDHDDEENAYISCDAERNRSAHNNNNEKDGRETLAKILN